MSWQGVPKRTHGESVKVWRRRTATWRHQTATWIVKMDCVAGLSADWSVADLDTYFQRTETFVFYHLDIGYIMGHRGHMKRK